VQISDEKFHYIHEITITVHVVSDPDLYDIGLYKIDEDTAGEISKKPGFAIRDEIFVLGTKKHGRIYPMGGYEVAGHELWHILKKHNKDFGNPDAE
jgi:hypothetical protein